MRSISKTRVMILAAAIVLLAVSLSWYRGEAAAGDQRPAPPPRPNPPEYPGARNIRPINVLLTSDGAKIDDRKVSTEELAAALDLFGGEDPENVAVNLVCADDVPMSEIRIFQETLMKLGISKISYVNGDGDSLPLQLPPLKALDRLEEMPDDFTIDVVVSADGHMTVGTRKVTAGNLIDVLREELSEQPLGIVVIHNDRETSYGDFTKVLELVKKAGAERVVVKFGDGR